MVGKTPFAAHPGTNLWDTCYMKWHQRLLKEIRYRQFHQDFRGTGQAGRPGTARQRRFRTCPCRTTGTTHLPWAKSSRLDICGRNAETVSLAKRFRPHLLRATAPVAFWYLPLGHWTHAACPASPWYCPGSHAEHSLEPPLPASRPLAHGTHFSCPSVLDTQSLHDPAAEHERTPVRGGGLPWPSPRPIWVRREWAGCSYRQIGTL